MSDEDKNVLVGYPTGGDAYISKTVVEVVGLRDQFAMAALTGLLANPKLQPEILKTGGAYGGWIEGSAWSWADAMMEKRK
jgi:hypothetical protein